MNLIHFIFSARLSDKIKNREHIKMIYACDNCLFIFGSSNDCKSCIDCGKPTIRAATLDECNEYVQRQTEFSESEYAA